MNIKAIIKAILFIPAAGMVLWACSPKGDAASDAASDSDNKIETVRIVTIESDDISRSITYTAHLQAFREVHLASASPGRINRILVDAGSRVSEGQLLVEMDQTQLQQAQLQLKNLEVDFGRLDTLRQVGSVSMQQFDQLRTQYELAQTNVAFLKENTRLLAPFSGTVSGKYFENGEMYSGAPNTSAGKAAILSLVQTSRLKAIVNVAERYYPNIRPGMAVSINSDMYPGEVFAGTVNTIYPTIDPATRSFKIEIAVPNASERLRPGMFARASMELEQLRAFVVPSLAILKLQGSNERYVFLEENGIARRVTVEIGDRYDDKVELISDEINEGDKLIVAGQSRLLDGMQVNVVR